MTVSTYILNYDRENLASLVVAIDDLRKMADKLEKYLVEVCEEVLEKEDDEWD